MPLFVWLKVKSKYLLVALLLRNDRIRESLLKKHLEKILIFRLVGLRSFSTQTTVRDRTYFNSELGIIQFYSENKESTNSSLLKTCKSSIASPTPMYFTGIFI